MDENVIYTAERIAGKRQGIKNVNESSRSDIRCEVLVISPTGLNALKLHLPRELIF